MASQPERQKKTRLLLNYSLSERPVVTRKLWLFNLRDKKTRLLLNYSLSVRPVVTRKLRLLDTGNGKRLQRSYSLSLSQQKKYNEVTVSH